MLSCLIACSYLQVFSWGMTGHRVVGQVAYQHLTPKAKKSIHKILKHEHLGMVGNYMDFVRSNPDMKYMAPWHYCTIPEGSTYEAAGVPEKSDAVQEIIRITQELKSKQFTYETELENLKYLVHLVGDIHQPLHVGNGEDNGGGKVKVEFMGEETNLHKVWDSDMIDFQQLSYMEYYRWVSHASKDQVEKWQSEDVMVWVDEALQYRKQIYDLPDDNKLSYKYVYDNIATVNERLHKAGIRLAGILNEIY